MKNKTIIVTLLLVVALILFYFLFIKGYTTQKPFDERDVFTEERKELVRDYLEANIETLSPQKAVLGGTFYVTDVTFQGANNAMVSYEDGHIALTADVDFTISEDGVVSIRVFDIREPDETLLIEETNFHETGMLTKGGTTDWTLIFEKPGKPALTVSLAFTNTSQCREKEVWIPCSPPKWQAGTQAEVYGTRKGDIVAVHTLKLPLKNDSPDADTVCEDLCGDGTCQEVVCMGSGCPCAETPSSCANDCPAQ